MDQPVQRFFQQLKLTKYTHGQEYHFFDGLYALEIDNTPSLEMLFLCKGECLFVI